MRKNASKIVKIGLGDRLWVTLDCGHNVYDGPGGGLPGSAWIKVGDSVPCTECGQA